VFRAILDPFTLLTIAATVTERVQLGTNVLNAPWYPPALLARSLTSIDLLSAGRLLPGFGIGWSPEEYEAVGIPMNERGARLDECLDALEALWATDPAEYHGAHWSVPATHANLLCRSLPIRPQPWLSGLCSNGYVLLGVCLLLVGLVKPAQTPRLPIYLAGFSAAAMRRVARRADGWLPVYRPGAGEFDPQTFVTTPLTRIRQMAEEAGRKPGDIGAVLRVYPTEDATVDETARALVRAEQEAGMEHAFVDLMNLAESVDHAAELAERILERAR
jgi:alkanesulfonate monooxygenase SsuD/methylene tetrahydromethanopterin reductase-like flavin-dependent oxidoreductase (luciferase family)